MAKLGDFKTPTGQSGNILNPRDWVSMILGTLVLLATFAIGQNVAKSVSSRVPAFDTTIDPIVAPHPVVTPRSNEIVI